jgi:hypothetical protein
VHPIGGVEETGSSFNQEFENEPTHVINSNYNMDGPEYTIRGVRHRTKPKHAAKRSYVFENSNLELIMSLVKDTVEPVDVIHRFEVKTQIGKTQNRDKKVNQDSYICQNMGNYWTFGVLDGHGQYGHNASAYVKRLLPKIIFSQKSKTNKIAAENKIEPNRPLYIKKNKSSPITTLDGSKQESQLKKRILNKDIIAAFKKVHK